MIVIVLLIVDESVNLDGEERCKLALEFFVNKSVKFRITHVVLFLVVLLASKSQDIKRFMGDRYSTFALIVFRRIAAKV